MIIGWLIMLQNYIFQITEKIKINFKRVCSFSAKTLSIECHHWLSHDSEESKYIYYIYTKTIWCFFHLSRSVMKYNTLTMPTFPFGSELSVLQNPRMSSWTETVGSELTERQGAPSPQQATKEASGSQVPIPSPQAGPGKGAAGAPGEQKQARGQASVPGGKGGGSASEPVEVHPSVWGGPLAISQVGAGERVRRPGACWLLNTCALPVQSLSRILFMCFLYL